MNGNCIGPNGGFSLEAERVRTRIQAKAQALKQLQNGQKPTEGPQIPGL
jgi:hypothetical protein